MSELTFDDVTHKIRQEATIAYELSGRSIFELDMCLPADEWAVYAASVSSRNGYDKLWEVEVQVLKYHHGVISVTLRKEETHGSQD